jgi:hypothetical protein
MHDLTALETNHDNEDWEWEGAEQEHDEADELESAAELLSLNSEEELDDFLGGLIRKAARAVNKGVRAATGNSLGGLLKGVVRQALPMVATAVGGPVGGLVAKRGLNAALGAFGLELELEGLSREDQELEVARRYVRFANDAARRLFRQPASANPRAQARSALQLAARRYAPGLLRGGPRQYAGRRAPARRHGRYYGAGRGYGECPPCDPCPVCPECGAPQPATPATAAAPEEPAMAEFEDENDLEAFGDFEGERGGEYEGDFEDETFGV